jgi:hypothetical protein
MRDDEDIIDSEEIESKPDLEKVSDEDSTSMNRRHMP